MVLKDGKIVRSLSDSLTPMSQIPPNVYLLKFNEMQGYFYLEQQEDFKLPEKLYGEIESLSQRFLNTFKQRGRNLGVLLKGIKGTGKSLLAKQICIDSNLPVILITEPYSGTGFETFLSGLGECIIFIDEFEKIYSEEKGNQSALLSIMDGVFEGKKLFLLTCNNELKINDALISRPSRIYYSKEYFGLEPEVISEVIDDLLINKEYKQELERICFILGSVNMDSLISIIDEMNRYEESPSEVLKYLNVKPEDAFYEISFKEITMVRNRFTDEESQMELSYKVFSNENPIASNCIVAYNASPETGQLKEGLYTYSINVDIELKDCDVVVKKDSLEVTSPEGVTYIIKKVGKKKNLVF